MSITARIPSDLFTRTLLRLSRREAVERGVLFLKALLSISGIALLIILGSDAISSRLFVGTAIKKLANDLHPIESEVSAKAPTRATYGSIVSRNVFGELGAKSTSPVGAGPKPMTKLPLNLIGTFLYEGEDPYAIIEDDKKKVQDVFRLQDSVFGDAKLTGIYPDRVEINRGGQTEILKLDDAPDVKPATGGPVVSSGQDEFVVDEGELDKALENLPLLLTQARAVPYFKDGKSIGLRLFAIKAGSLFEKVGLMNGDILKSINGNNLGDISQAMKLFEMLKSERSLAVSVERNREEREFKYQIR